jgi:calcium permeable stress-gated cation channel
MMCDRLILGALLFQVTMAGQLATRGAVKRSTLLAPLVVGTLWFGYVYSQTYRPLMKFIALRSLRGAEHSDLGRAIQEDAFAPGQRRRRIYVGRETVDEARERGARFESPSLVMPLDDMWIIHKHSRSENSSAAHTENGDPEV